MSRMYFSTKLQVRGPQLIAYAITKNISKLNILAITNTEFLSDKIGHISKFGKASLSPSYRGVCICFFDAENIRSYFSNIVYPFIDEI